MSETADGIVIAPLYEEGAGPRAWRAAAGPWTVTQRIDLPDAAAANEQALEDLSNGATGLALIFQGAAAGHGFGLAEHDQRNIARALADVRLDCIALNSSPARMVAAPPRRLVPISKRFPSILSASICNSAWIRLA